MNVILGELRRAGVEHETLEDVFSLAESISDACDFFRQPGESRLRVLDLAASLFDHVAAECIGDVAALNAAEGAGDAGGVGALRAPLGTADRRGGDAEDDDDDDDRRRPDGGEDGGEDGGGSEGEVAGDARRRAGSERDEAAAVPDPRR
nr:protein UL91 [Murid betaherpesvirus 2]